MVDQDNCWKMAAAETIVSYRHMIDAATKQLTDEELFQRPADGINSVAHILRHLAGNLQSRWTDFRTTDGEKATRDRDAEFHDWKGDRQSLEKYFDEGWQILTDAIQSITPEDEKQEIFIRGEAHTIPQAIFRSLTHISYHVGQVMIISRMVRSGDWNWLTIAPDSSKAHNQSTWGTSSSRGTLGESSE